MELLYHVTKEDDILGPISRDHAHAHHLLHRTGIVFLLNGAHKVLINIRSPHKTIFPSTYDASVSFHVTFGEAYETAAKREMFEEIGIRSPVTYLGKFLHHDPPEYQIVAVFVGVSDDTPIVDPSEFSDDDFYSMTQVDDIIHKKTITPWLRDGWPFLKDHVKREKLDTNAS